VALKLKELEPSGGRTANTKAHHCTRFWWIADMSLP